jgi:hypothetical protein
MVFTCQKCFKKLATQQSLNYHQKTSKCGQNTEKLPCLSYTLGMCILGEIHITKSCRVINLKKQTFNMSIGDDLTRYLHVGTTVQLLRNMLQVTDFEIIKDTLIMNGCIYKYILVKEELYKLKIIDFEFDFYVYVNTDLIVEHTNMDRLKGIHLKDILQVDCLCNVMSKQNCTISMDDKKYDCVVDKKEIGYYITCKNSADN